MNVITKGLEGYDKYLVYSDGKVWSHNQKKFLKPMMLNERPAYRLYKGNSEYKYWYVSKLMMVCFKGLPMDSNKRIRHIDGNPLNNDLGNLVIDTSCRRPETIQEDEYKKICAMLEDKKSLKEISRTFNISNWHIKKINSGEYHKFHAHNVKIERFPIRDEFSDNKNLNSISWEVEKLVNPNG